MKSGIFYIGRLTMNPGFRFTSSGLRLLAQWCEYGGS